MKYTIGTSHGSLAVEESGQGGIPVLLIYGNSFLPWRFPPSVARTARGIEVFVRAIFGESAEPFLGDAVARADGRFRKRLFEAARVGEGVDQRLIVVVHGLSHRERVCAKFIALNTRRQQSHHDP